MPASALSPRNRLAIVSASSFIGAVCADPEFARLGLGDVAVAGGEKHGQAGMSPLQAGSRGRCHSRPAHYDVAENEIELIFAAVDQRQRGFGARDDVDLIAELFKHQGRHLGHARIVLDQ